MMDYKERLEKSLLELEKNSGKLADLPDFVKGINELIEIYTTTNALTVESQKNLEKIESELKERSENLQRTLKLEQESKEELLNTIRSALTANNKEQLDAVNSITMMVNNKISIAESNLTVKTTEIDNNLKTVESKILENRNKLDTITNNISSLEEKMLVETSEIKLSIPIIKRIQIFSIISAVLALVACILNFVV